MEYKVYIISVERVAAELKQAFNGGFERRMLRQLKLGIPRQKLLSGSLCGLQNIHVRAQVGNVHGGQTVLP